MDQTNTSTATTDPATRSAVLAIYQIMVALMAGTAYRKPLEFAGELSRNPDLLRTLTGLIQSQGFGATPSRRLLVGKQEVILKLENVNKTSAYKIRGALIATMAALLGGKRELVTASTGNHGRAVIQAAQLFPGVVVHIFAPSDIPPIKLDKLCVPGVHVRLVDGDFGSVKRAAIAFAAEGDREFVHAYDSIFTVAGQATCGQEIADAHHRYGFDCVVTPMGGTGLAAGLALALNANETGVPLIGVASAAAPSAYASFRHPNREIQIVATAPSLAGGVLVDAPGEIPWSILNFPGSPLSDVQLVTDEEVEEAIAFLWEHNIWAEGAGAVGFAAVLAGRIPGHRPLVVISGGNIAENDLLDIVRRVDCRRALARLSA